MDCSICQTDMGQKAFINGISEDTDESDSVFRLKCGHAFHTSCICRSLRSTSNCPMCRSGPETIANLRIQDGQLHFDFQEEDIDIPDFTNVAQAQEQLNLLNRSPEVQRARARVNRFKKDYRSCEMHIMRQRKRLIDESLTFLENKYKSKFITVKDKLQSALSKLKAEEQKLIPDTNYILEANPGAYSVEAQMSQDFGPLKMRFWNRS